MPESAANIPWGTGIIPQGEAYEAYVLKESPSGTIDLNAGNAAKNFEAYDNWNASTGIATSVKTLDATLTSYQSPGSLLSKLMSYVTDIDDFKAGNYVNASGQTATLSASQIHASVLDVAIRGPITAAQFGAVQAFIDEAATEGVHALVTLVQR